jgi:hypothetical protein
LGFKLAGDFAPEKVAVAGMIGLMGEMEDFVSRLTGSLRKAKEGQSAAVHPSAPAGLVPKVEIEVPAISQASPLVEEKPAEKVPAWRRLGVAPAVDPAYAPRALPLSEKRQIETEERRKRNQKEYDPFIDR